MAAEAQGNDEDGDPGDEESQMMVLKIDRIHDLPELFARGDFPNLRPSPTEGWPEGSFEPSSPPRFFKILIF